MPAAASQPCLFVRCMRLFVFTRRGKALSVLWPRRIVRAVGAAALAVCFATGACTAFWLGAQAVHPSESPRDLTLTAAEEQAMEVLRSEMQPGETFVTNRIHTGKALEGEPCLAEQWVEDGALSLIFENEDTMIFRAA